MDLQCAKSKTGGSGRDINNGRPPVYRLGRTRAARRRGLSAAALGEGSWHQQVTNAAYNGETGQSWPCLSHQGLHGSEHRGAPSCVPGGAAIRWASRPVSIRIWEVKNPKHHLFLTLLTKGKLKKTTVFAEQTKQLSLKVLL